MSGTAFDLSPDHRWLFLFAHPDDELAVAAWMRRLRAANVLTKAAWMHSTVVREAESRNALSKLGWEDDAISFFRLPDGDMVDHLDELQKVVAGLVAEHRPTRIATMAFEQGHLDHDSVNMIANLCLPGRVIEFPMYHGYWRSFMPLNEFATGVSERLTLSQEESRLKRELLDSYPSQTIKRNVYMYGVLQRIRRRPIAFDRRELARLQVHTNWMVPNHPPETLPRVVSSKNWRRWLRAVESLFTPVRG